MTITTIKTPNDIIMSLSPELNKHEFLMTLILVNGCCQKFYKGQTEIYLAETYIKNNILLTDSLKFRMSKTMNNLVGQKLICDEEKSPTVVLFENIDKKNKQYLIKINPTVRTIFDCSNNYTILDCEIMTKLKTINSLKFYCLMKRWAVYGNYHCYIGWLKWYLNVKHTKTKYLFRDYIDQLITVLDKYSIKIKMVKCRENLQDKKIINKLIFNTFDTSKEFLHENL